jgi:hypothetical protein
MTRSFAKKYQAHDYKLGQTDFDKGVLRDQNPITMDQHSRSAWFHGWDDACAEPRALKKEKQKLSRAKIQFSPEDSADLWANIEELIKLRSRADVETADTIMRLNPGITATPVPWSAGRLVKALLQDELTRLKQHFQIDEAHE